MAINTTAFAAALQTKMDATTDAKEMLLLGKAYESTEANIVLADINAAGVVATTKASEASASATSATGSASTATTKAAAALASEGVATTKASEASASATAASGSASSASGSATTATTKASEASASATAAATSESNAANAATTAVNAVIDTAPANLNTLNELAEALGDDANYAATTTTALGNRYTKTETDAKIVELSPPATKAHIESLGIAANTITGALPAIDGSALTGLASVNQAQVQTHLTTTSSQSITTDVVYNISGLSATITPTTTSKRIKVTVRWSGEFSNSNNYDTLFGIKRGTTAIGNPTGVGNRKSGITCSAVGYSATDSDSTPDTAFYSYIDSPNTTSATTYYGTYMHNTVSGTLYNQRTVADADSSNTYERLTSSITLEEID